MSETRRFEIDNPSPVPPYFCESRASQRRFQGSGKSDRRLTLVVDLYAVENEERVSSERLRP
jgi:hypothetical protein